MGWAMLEKAKKNPGKDSHYIASAFNAKGNSLLNGGKLNESEANLQKALALRKKTQWENNIHVAFSCAFQTWQVQASMLLAPLDLSGFIWLGIFSSCKPPTLAIK